MLYCLHMNSSIIIIIENTLKALGFGAASVKTSHDKEIGSDVLSLNLPEKHLWYLTKKEPDFVMSLRLVLKQVLVQSGCKGSIIDINGEDIDFIDYTKQKAKIAADRVRDFDKEYEFGYLNAYERMIVHSYLKGRTEISTESIGEGLERRLIVKKREQ